MFGCKKGIFRGDFCFAAKFCDLWDFLGSLPGIRDRGGPLKKLDFFHREAGFLGTTNYFRCEGDECWWCWWRMNPPTKAEGQSLVSE